MYAVVKWDDEPEPEVRVFGTRDAADACVSDYYSNREPGQFSDPPVVVRVLNADGLRPDPEPLPLWDAK